MFQAFFKPITSYFSVRIKAGQIDSCHSKNYSWVLGNSRAQFTTEGNFNFTLSYSGIYEAYEYVAFRAILWKRNNESHRKCKGSLKCSSNTAFLSFRHVNLRLVTGKIFKRPQNWTTQESDLYLWPSSSEKAPRIIWDKTNLTVPTFAYNLARF